MRLGEDALRAFDLRDPVCLSPFIVPQEEQSMGAAALRAAANCGLVPSIGVYLYVRSHISYQGMAFKQPLIALRRGMAAKFREQIIQSFKQHQHHVPGFFTIGFHLIFMLDVTYV